MSRIDLEDAIYKVWQTSDDLDMFYHYHGDHPKPMTEDEVANTLLGLKMLHDMRVEQLFLVFKKEFQLDEFCVSEEALAARKLLAGLHEEINTPKKKKGKKK